MNWLHASLVKLPLLEEHPTLILLHQRLTLFKLLIIFSDTWVNLETLNLSRNKITSLPVSISQSLGAVQVEHSCMNIVTRKPVFGVCDQVRLKPSCTAVETSLGHEILGIETKGIILSRHRTTMALIRLRRCAG